MIRGILKRTVSLFLVIAMVLSLVSFTVSAAELAGLNVEGLTAESAGDANWTASEGNQITGTATGTSGTCGNESKSGVLVLKNTKSNMATLSFDYTLTLNNGTVKIGNTSVTENSSYSVELASNETLSITVTSDKAATSTIIILKNIKLVTNTDVNVSFEPSVGGTIKVNDETISAPRTYSQNSSVGFQITATPASSYKFFRWENENGTVVSNKKSDTIYPDYDQTIHAVFLDSTSPVFSVSGTTFTDLGEAIDYAVSANQSVIALIENGTISGNYTIPNGKTLLIPFDDALTVYKNTPEVVYGSHTTPSVFKTLTMANGSSITVASGGAICVPSKLSATGTGTGSWNGTPTGKYGKIAMNSGSSITVENGGGLYVYGYISGTGNVLAKSGATVYEAMQFRCWRGGSATLDMINGSVFPMTQYYVQNIEAFLTLEAGAQENVYTSVNMNSSAYPASASFIGTSGMFTIGTGKIVKHYDGPTDRLIIDVEGDLSIKSLSLSLAGQSVNTKDYVLPINSNISINVKSGTTTIDAAQKVALLPGAELTVSTEAQVIINSSVYVYDKDEWGNYAAAGVQLVPVGYSTVNGTTAKRNANSLVDAKVDINGNVYVNGALYTTAGGAAIVSSAGSGKIVFNKTAGTETATQQVTQSGKSISTVSIPITPARLLNGDGSYTPTANLLANTEVPYIGTGSEGKWLTGVQAFQIYFDANGGTGTMPPQTVIVGTEATLNKNTFTREGYDFVCWNTAADGSGQSIPDEYSGTIPATGDITLYAQWSVQKFTVTWNNDDGTLLELDENVPYGTTPSYDGQTPTKAADAQYSYTFAGWSPEPSDVTGNVTYTATYTSTVNTYTVIWKNEDGTVLEKDENVPYGTEPTYDGETPTKAGDAQYSYTFTGWTPEPAAVTGDVTYTAVFRQTVNTYTVKWLNEDGSILETDKNVPYGTTPEYNGEEPTKDPTASTVYTFTGWTPEVEAVTGDVSYTAKFSESIRLYTITWKNQNGEVIETNDAAYGEAPFHAPLDAYQDEHYSYSFAGWKDETGHVYSLNDALPTVDGDAVYTAVFSTSLVNGYYLIGLHGWDAADLLPEDKLYENQENASEMMLEHVKLQVGNEFKVVYLNNGELTWYPENAGNYVVDAGHAGEDKLVIFNPKGTGSGDGWHAGYLFVPLNEYTVTWKDWDGREFRTERYYHGEIPSYLNADVTENPSRQEDEANVYSFDGWNDGTKVYSGTLPAVTADVVYTAHFAASPRMYDILWIVGEEEIHSEWAYGTTPVYMVNGEPATPTKAPDAEFTYTFDHWEPAIEAVNGNATYVAKFNETKNTYTITWIVNGVETQETYEYGDTPVYKVNGEAADPTKEADAQYSYSFAGWSPTLDTVTGDAEYTAIFDQTVNKYRVHFRNENGEELWFDDVEYGTVPVYGGEAFDKPDTDQYSYSFLGWFDGTEVYTDALPAVNGEVSYTAVFTATLRSYTITWIIDGTEETEEYPYGETPSHAEPYKEPDAQYSYTFTGWDPQIEPVTGPATYTAQFSEVLRSYLVTFNNYDNSFLYSVELPYGSMPEYQGEAPVKPDDEHYSYTFIGWEPELAEVKGSAVYVAQYRAELLIPNGYYLVGSFNDWTPSAQYLFTQSGDRYVRENVQLAVGNEMKVVRYEDGEPAQWYPDGGAATNYVVPEGREGSKTVWFSPDYLEEFFQDGGCGYLYVPRNVFTVTWNNDDGTQLELDENVPYGTMPSYDGQTPTKAADDQYSYTFAGWSPELSAVTGNVTYTATYTSTVNTYTVIWKNEDGTVLETDENVPYGAMPTYDGAMPVKNGNEEHSYEFAGWNPTVAKVTGDAVYTALFTESTNSYTVTWNNDDGTQLELDENVPYGTMPSYDGQTPVKEPSAEFIYTFAGWTPEPGPVTGNATYTATFTSEKRSYTIRFVNDNGDLLYSGEFKYGTVPEYAGETPVKEGDAQYSYTFAGWTPAIVAVHGDATYTAVFDATVNKYLITFVNEDGTELYSAMVAYGDTPVYDGETPTKTNTAQYTYTFAGWNPKIVTVTGEATYKAVFDAEVNEYLIRFVNYNGDLLYSDMFAYGATPVYDGDTPAKEGNAQYSYTFTGWDPEIEAVTGEATYKAIFEESVNRYLITFINEDDTELYSAKFDYGEQPVYGGPEPAKQTGANETGAYRFIGWEPEITEVTGDKTYTAKFSYTGFRSDEQGLRYYVDNEMQTGLVLADGETYYMDPDTGYAVTGLVRLVLENGEVNYYYFTENYQAVKDGTYKVDNNNGLPLPCFNYNFDANGVIEHDPDTSKNGLSVPSDDPNGLFYMIDGIKVGMGLLKIDGSYYYARTSSGEIVRNRTYYVSVTNGLPIEPGMYSFDAEGRMILNGFFDENSSTYYYQDGVMAKGFTKIGEDYYFFNAGSGKLYKDIRLWVPVNEYGVEPGYYYFGVDGKMELPAPKNGFIEEGGYSYYYVNGERAKGFTKIGEDYYFFNAGNGRMYKDIKLWVPENEYGVEPGYYDFGADGKMVQPDVKNGFVEESGSTYYYVDGEKAKGLMKIGEDFYFFNQSSGKMYKGMKLWVADHPEYGIVGGMYQFDEEGRMVLPG